MRVLFDHQIFSYQAFGGASRYFVELMARFADRGDPQFTLGVAETPNEYLARASFYRGKIVEPRFLRTYARNSVATLAASRRHHDILHATFYDPAITAVQRRSKLVVTVHDMIPEKFPELFAGSGLYNRFVTQRWIAGKRTLCERADAIIAVSEHTKTDLVELYGVAPDRITVIHHGASLTPSTSRPYWLPDDYVLFVGQRGLYKNFRVVVEALHGEKLVCIGGGPFSDAERAQLVEHHVSAIQRSVSDAELAACYAHARVFVFPSRYEGFGIPILEAFACDCPVVLARASCFPEIAGDAAAYFTPDSVSELSAALGQAVSRRESLVAAGRARLQEFSWDRAASATAAVYRSTM